MSKHLFILFEHAAGYALFSVKEFDEVAALLPQVESSVTDISKFQSVVKLVAFQAFRNGPNSLDNINAIAAGELHPDLQTFLEKEVPASKKKVQVILGVGDSKIGQVISDTLGISCQHAGIVTEIMRGIRTHFPHFINALTEATAGKAQLGLGHSYSRDKVKFNVNRVDNMIIQSISLLDQLDKDINTFSMRIREWYSYHFPELVKIVNDNYMFARLTNLIGDRTKLQPEMADSLEEVVMDSAKVKAIFEAAKSSMGIDIGTIDLINIQMFAKRVISLTEYRKSLSEYLHSKMQSVAPNLAALIGEQVGARLISHAGSLTNLAKYPASTVQILGAEKALFRALKTRGNTPKYGLIFHSTFIGRAGAKNKGRISRYLANKCSIASRVDNFSDVPTAVIGEHLKQQVEDRLKFYETGENPAKNIDVMKQAVVEAQEAREKVLKQQKKLARREKKRKLKEAESNHLDESSIVENTTENGTPAKKKKKKKTQDDDEVITNDADTTVEEVKKKKKKKTQDEDEAITNDADTTVEEVKKSKKKKKKKSEVEDSSNMEVDETEAVITKKQKKKKSAE
ncbi:nucleolar protein 56 [Biomphalaria glabrata]|uniref:Nucleolar protein 56 n=1 Tax=Biomphalaria glabrata TaxID=6526 RepID=A0A9U8EHD0_BIOGL|nr:nucleolar protein 56-like [Biomphalaria glabrata]KAI8768689.1 nucleolar protein 56-like [Biomphalaria glabrata]KAI8777892.1 nucleolar protein 56 [Biomphalaria glabrata]